MNEWIKIWENIKLEFRLSGWDTITNPGKFEGETLLTPFFYEVSMISAQDETLYDSNETPYCVFKTESWLNQGMPEDFEKMAGFYGYKYFVLEETGSGFVFLAGMSEKEYKKWLAGLNV